jgi:hypothetical protein
VWNGVQLRDDRYSQDHFNSLRPVFGAGFKIAVESNPPFILRILLVLDQTRTHVANGAMVNPCSEPGDAGLTWRQKADAIPWVGWLAWLPGVGVLDLLFVPAQGFPIITTKFSKVGAILASPTVYECH